MNNTLYKIKKRKIKENRKYPWFVEQEVSVSEFGMEIISQKKRRKR